MARHGGAITAAMALVACQGPGAPTASGVCWRAGAGPGRFTALAKEVSSLDDCAAQLEALHLAGARTVEGAFQGYFIFVDGGQISSSTTADGFRYPIFQPGQRKEIDADLRDLIHERNGQSPAPGDISVQRR